MSVIEQAKAHFSTKEVRKTKVPEWDTTIYCKPLTLDDRAKIAARAEGNATDYLVYAVIFGSTNEQGEMIFGIDDKLALRKQCDPQVVSRVANFILSSETKTEEEREKN